MRRLVRHVGEAEPLAVSRPDVSDGNGASSSLTDYRQETEWLMPLPPNAAGEFETYALRVFCGEVG